MGDDPEITKRDTENYPISHREMGGFPRLFIKSIRFGNISELRCSRRCFTPTVSNRSNSVYATEQFPKQFHVLSPQLTGNQNVEYRVRYQIEAIDSRDASISHRISIRAPVLLVFFVIERVFCYPYQKCSQDNDKRCCDVEPKNKE